MYSKVEYTFHSCKIATGYDINCRTTFLISITSIFSFMPKLKYSLFAYSSFLAKNMHLIVSYPNKMISCWKRLNSLSGAFPYSFTYLSL